MPESLKNKPNSKEFKKYLSSFVKNKERLHRKKVLHEIVDSALLIIA